MIVRDAVAAYLHYVAIFVTVFALGSELAIYRRNLSQSFARTLQRVDILYLIGAVALIATGIFRILASEQGWPFFARNPVFWLKMGLFATLGILSIWPTRHFLEFGRSPGDAPVAVDGATYGRIRALLFAEIAILFLIPLCASLMSRGIGLPQ